MSGLSDLRLWNRLLDYHLDKTDIGLPFSARLARDNGWEPDFARQVCDEYKKFIYLICTSDDIVTPSNAVDEAWHLHLAYTRDYWQRFCRDTLGRDIHHTPTEGGEAERQKYRAAYERTLHLYEREFGEKPPVAIWPEPAVRFDMANLDPERPYYRVSKRATRWGLALAGGGLGAGLATVVFSATLMAALFVGVIVVLFLAPGTTLGAEISLTGGGDGDSGCGGCGGCG